MAPSEVTARRAILALGIAIVAVAAPIVVATSGPSPAVAPRVLAGCTTSSEPGNAELDCEPPAVHEVGGAPSEMQLTEEEDIGDPSSPVHGR